MHLHLILKYIYYSLKVLCSIIFISPTVTITFSLFNYLYLFDYSNDVKNDLKLLVESIFLKYLKLKHV